MFEDMRHAGGILRHGAQADQEDVVAIRRREMEMARAGGEVLEFVDMQLQRLDPLAALEGKGGMMGGNGILGGCHFRGFSPGALAGIRYGGWPG